MRKSVIYFCAIAWLLIKKIVVNEDVNKKFCHNFVLFFEERQFTRPIQ